MVYKNKTSPNQNQRTMKKGTDLRERTTIINQKEGMVQPVHVIDPRTPQVVHVQASSEVKDQNKRSKKWVVENEPETHELREGVVEGVFHYSALTRLEDATLQEEHEEPKDRPEEEKPAEDRFKVGEEFDECQHGTDCRLETCGSNRNNVLHSTMTEDELAKPGDEGALLGNLLGFKNGISVTEYPNSSGIKCMSRMATGV